MESQETKINSEGVESGSEGRQSVNSDPNTGERPQAGRVSRPQQGRVSNTQGSQSQGRSAQPQRRPVQQQGQVQGRPPVSRNGQPQPQRRPVRPVGQSQGRVPYPQGGQPARAPRAGQPGNGVPNGPVRRPANGPQGQFVQRRPGGPQNMAPARQGLFGRQLMEASRKMFHSPLFLIMAVLNTVFVITTLASVFMKDVNFSQVINILANFDAPSELMAYANRIISLLSNLSSGVIVFNLISHLPEILLCIGLWILIVTSKTQEDEMSGIGFLCTKIYMIIKMVVTSLVLLVCLILSVMFVVSAWVSGGRGPKIISSVFLAVMIVAAMVCIMYYFCLLHTIKVCRMNAIRGKEFGSVSVYAAVLTILIALVSILGILSAVVNFEIAGIVSFACKLIWMMLAGVWMFLYKNRINDDDDEEEEE